MIGNFYKRSESMSADEIQANLVYFLEDDKGSGVLQGSTLDRFTHLIGLGGDINTQDKDGQTLLMKASWYSHDGFVSGIIKRFGADANIQDNEGRTALTHCRDPASFDTLLDAGANAHHAADDGMTPLLRASGIGAVSVVGRLIGLGADIHASNESTVLINMVPKESVNRSFEYFQACTKTFERLIALGVNLDAQNSHGTTALMKAVCYTSIPSIKLLLKSGASPFITNNKGESALDIVAQLDFRDSQSIRPLIVEAIEARESQARSGNVSSAMGLAR